MRKQNNNQKAFFALVRAGLWGDVKVNGYRLKLKESAIDWGEIMRLAEEQAVIGLIADGIDRFKTQVSGFQIPQEWALQFIGTTLQLEQQNKAMNSFIAIWLKKLQKAGVNPVLIKGQGIAQCYQHPLWRANGDVDLLVNSHDYNMAKSLLISYSQTEAKETETTKEYCLTIEGWAVELHGTLYCRLTKRLDAFLDKIQDDCCNRRGVRTWDWDGTEVLLPSEDNDVFVIFTHIVKHYFREGVGLRQLCDWCRLMWTYREKLDLRLLESRIREAGLNTEWKAFAALAVEYLGMPVEAMPLYSSSWMWKRKATRIMDFVFETGNFGHNRGNSYTDKKPRLVVKAISLWRHTWDLARQFLVFPMDSVRVWWSMVRIGVNQVKKEAKEKGKNLDQKM